MLQRRGNTLIPVVIIILALAAAIGVFAFSIWPKDEEFDVNPPIVRTHTNSLENNNSTDTNRNVNAVNINVNSANTNTAVNSNTSVDQTKDWKTYENASLGFSLRHPADWEIDDTSTPNKVWFNPVGAEILDSIQTQAADRTLEQIYANADSSDGTKEYTTLGGERAVRLNLASFGLVQIYATHNNKLYVVGTNNQLKKNPKILETFTFTK